MNKSVSFASWPIPGYSPPRLPCHTLSSLYDPSSWAYAETREVLVFRNFSSHRFHFFICKMGAIKVLLVIYCCIIDDPPNLVAYNHKKQ